MLDLQAKLDAALAAVNQAGDLQALEAVKVDYLGKKGVFTEILKSLADLSPEERPTVGQQINVVKRSVQDAISQRYDTLQTAVLTRQLEGESLDVIS